jgi:4-hydroxybenzoate polyprenyltransferase
MIRTFAGEVATGYHVPIWLLLTIFFISLFMATVKRHAEIVAHGREARAALKGYNEYHLYFLTTTFATLTIIAYSFYAFFYQTPDNESAITGFFSQIYPQFEARRWLMVTIPLVVYGIARYAQLLYERTEGERPENIITKDKPLVATIFLWGVVVIILTYVL